MSLVDLNTVEEFVRSKCGRQVGCVQSISGWVLRESQTDGTSINGTRTV